MSGTIEGGALNLSVENGTGLSLVTGNIDGDNLRLTFFGDGNSKQVTFTKSDAAKFTELANDKRHRAAENKQEIETAAAMKDRVEQRGKTQRSIDQLADSIFVKSQEVQEKSKKIEIVISGYRVAEERAGKMRSARQRTGTGSPGEYRVSQIDYQLDSLSNDVERTHNQVQIYTQGLNDFIANAASKTSALLGKCQIDELLNCSRLSASLQSLRTRYQQFQNGYQRENAAFKARQS